jgi:hypothetical protein
MRHRPLSWPEAGGHEREGEGEGEEEGEGEGMVGAGKALVVQMVATVIGTCQELMEELEREPEMEGASGRTPFGNVFRFATKSTVGMTLLGCKVCFVCARARG